jgi:hypothetical protein
VLAGAKVKLERNFLVTESVPPKAMQLLCGDLADANAFPGELFGGPRQPAGANCRNRREAHEKQLFLGLKDAEIDYGTLIKPKPLRGIMGFHNVSIPAGNYA